VTRLLALLLLIAPSAQADLYRWVDPQTGSVKFSNVPPPASQPDVEVVPYRAPAGGGVAAPPGATAPSPAPAQALPEGAVALEQRWRQLLAQIAEGAASPGESAALQQQLREFAATGVELDRLDPAGTARRRAEAQRKLQRVLQDER